MSVPSLAVLLLVALADATLSSTTPAVVQDRATRNGATRRSAFKGGQLGSIPKLLHVTARALTDQPVLGCRRVNSDWQFRFYNDSQLLQYVQAHAPTYVDVLHRMATPVLKADFFRCALRRHKRRTCDIHRACEVPAASSRALR